MKAKHRVRPARRRRVQLASRAKCAEAAQHQPERVDVVGVAGDAGDDVGIAACTARAARRSATTPEAPPIGMWSSQRGAQRPGAASGPPRCRARARSSTRTGRRSAPCAMPARSTSSSSARPGTSARRGRVALRRAPSPARRRRRLRSRPLVYGHAQPLTGEPQRRRGARTRGEKRTPKWALDRRWVQFGKDALARGATRYRPSSAGPLRLCASAVHRLKPQVKLASLQMPGVDALRRARQRARQRLQLAALHLLRWRQRQAVDEGDVARRLVVGQLLQRSAR